jgi:hypothetical protein
MLKGKYSNSLFTEYSGAEDEEDKEWLLVCFSADSKKRMVGGFLNDDYLYIEFMDSNEEYPPTIFKVKRNDSDRRRLDTSYLADEINYEFPKEEVEEAKQLVEEDIRAIKKYAKEVEGVDLDAIEDVDDSEEEEEEEILVNIKAPKNKKIKVRHV